MLLIFNSVADGKEVPLQIRSIDDGKVLRTFSHEIEGPAPPPPPPLGCAAAHQLLLPRLLPGSPASSSPARGGGRPRAGRPAGGARAAPGRRRGRGPRRPPAGVPRHPVRGGRGVCCTSTPPLARWRAQPLFEREAFSEGEVALGGKARENGGDWNKSTCAMAAMGGHLQVLQWLRGEGCPWDHWTCHHAVDKGHVWRCGLGWSKEK